VCIVEVRVELDGALAGLASGETWWQPHSDAEFAAVVAQWGGVVRETLASTSLDDPTPGRLARHCGQI